MYLGWLVLRLDKCRTVLGFFQTSPLNIGVVPIFKRCSIGEKCVVLTVWPKVFWVDIWWIFVEKALTVITRNRVNYHVRHTLVLRLVFVCLHEFDFLVEVVGLIVLLFDSGVLSAKLALVVVAIRVVVIELGARAGCGNTFFAVWTPDAVLASSTLSLDDHGLLGKSVKFEFFMDHLDFSVQSAYLFSVSRLKITKIVVWVLSIRIRLIL